MQAQKRTRGDYDVIVVGAGLGGLSAAALLSKMGKTVLVLEQGPKWGGYAHSFTAGPYTFDPAVHVFAQGHEGALPDALLRHLGVRERCRMIPAHSNYSAVFDDLTFHAPFGLEDFIEAHARLFPREADGIARFFRLCQRVHREAHEMPPRIGVRGLDEVARRFPDLVRYLRSTVAEVVDEYLVDPRLKGLCTVLWPYAGAPPSRLSFVTFATTLSVYLDGAFYCEGSFQSLADAFAAATERHGGEIRLRNRVARIIVEDHRAAGVVLDDGESVRAPVIVSNADARRTLEEMVGEEHLPAGFLRRLRRMKPSLSAFVAFTSTNLDLAENGFAHEIFRPLHFDHEATMRDIADVKPGGIWGSVPTLLDPSLAPPGEHILIITSLARYDPGKPWAELRERYVAELVRQFEVVFPGLQDALTFVQAASPSTLERFCLNTGGAAYAWENTPAQSGGKRSPHQPPLGGLFLSGHWTQPGSGSLRAIVSGMHTAQLVLASNGDGRLDFDHPDLPPAGE